MTVLGFVMLRRAIILLLLVSAALSAGWLAVQREPIPYDVLENRYASLASKFTTLGDGLIVHYIDEGPRDEPAVLLVHGLASSTDSWGAWRAGLEGTHRVISVDLPGHGLTRSPDLAEIPISYLSEFIDEFSRQLGLEDYVLVGASLGGHAGWYYALDHAERLNGLVLIGSAGLPNLPDETDRLSLSYQLASNPLLLPLTISADPRPLIRSGLEAAFVDVEMVSKALVNQYTDYALAPGHRRTILQIVSRPRDTAVSDQDRLEALDLPVLILQGQDDQITPLTHSERLRDLIPGAGLVVYPDVGHLPHEEAPDRSLADLVDFLNGLTVNKTEAPQNPEAPL